MRELKDGFRYCTPGWERKSNRIASLVFFSVGGTLSLGSVLMSVAMWVYSIYLVFRGGRIRLMLPTSFVMLPLAAFYVYYIRRLWWDYINATRIYCLHPEGMEVITRKKHDMIPWEQFHSIQVVPCGSGKIGVIEKYCICCMRCPQKDTFLHMVEFRGLRPFYHYQEVIFIDFNESVFQEISALYPRRIPDLGPPDHPRNRCV